MERLKLFNQRVYLRISEDQTTLTIQNYKSVTRSNLHCFNGKDRDIAKVPINKVKYVNKIDNAKAKCKIDKYTIYLELGSYYEFYVALLYQMHKNRY